MEDGGAVMALLASFRDLEVYKLARQQAKRLFLISQSFPKEERYSLTDQVRRSSRAVGALIAESWARRLYKAAFINKVNEAMGEAMETQAWLDQALDCAYLDAPLHAELDKEWHHISAMLNRVIECADSFCKSSPKR
jgi:four helix bundle protein